MKPKHFSGGFWCRIISMDKNILVIEKQIGNLSAWSWSGDYKYRNPDENTGAEWPKCLCGKPLIHCFVITKNDESGQTAIVGSECVKLFHREGRALAHRLRPSQVMVR